MLSLGGRIKINEIRAERSQGVATVGIGEINRASNRIANVVPSVSGVRDLLTTAALR